MLRYIIALTLSVASLQLSARTIGDFFGMAEADTAFPIIDATTRLDMLDYAHSGLTTPSNNRQSGVARIISINDTTLSMQLNMRVLIQFAEVHGSYSPQGASPVFAHKGFGDNRLRVGHHRAGA